MTSKEKIIALCQNPNLSEQDFVVAIEKELKNVLPYDHDDDNIMSACNINEDIIIELDTLGSGSQVIEEIEGMLTKRKLAFVLFHRIIEEQKGGKSRSQSKPKTFDELIERLRGGMSSEPVDDYSCQEEDDSECWKCRKKSNCNKFRGFQNN